MPPLQGADQVTWPSSRKWEALGPICGTSRRLV